MILKKTLLFSYRSDQPLMPNPILMETTANDGNFPILKSASVGNIHRFYHDDTVDGKLPGDDEEKDDANFDDVASTASLDYRFSIGQLPNWAKAKASLITNLHMNLVF